VAYLGFGIEEEPIRQAATHGKLAVRKHLLEAADHFDFLADQDVVLWLMVALRDTKRLEGKCRVWLTGSCLLDLIRRFARKLAGKNRDDQLESGRQHDQPEGQYSGTDLPFDQTRCVLDHLVKRRGNKPRYD
jgi:hypothetical protein